MQRKPDIICAVTDSHGIYAPQVFLELYGHALTGSWARDTREVIRQGPYGESYLDAWIDVENNGTVRLDGTRYRIYHDGDIFLIPEGMEWDDSEMWFTWPNETEEQA